MSKIYALLVAIDQYPNPAHRLRGCVNDMTSVKDYLTNTFSDSDQLHLKVLADEEASRENIINGFNHFAKAKDGDSCLFYYCGHGSQAPAAEAFWHIEADKMNESLVCWDSRSEGGFDLMDKELSYLIWKATKAKDLHFVVWMDCCHSGSNTRSTEEVRSRMAETSTRSLPSLNYYGIEDYKKTETPEGLQLSPPRGKHIHLAAAKSSETAKELKINGQSRGIFTYCMLETLTETAGNLSYNELINRARIKIRHRVSNQSPQVEATRSEELALPFFNQSKAAGSSYLLSHDKNLGWVVNAGQVQGVDISNATEKSVFKTKDNTLLEITKVLPTQSVVKGAENFDIAEIHQVQHLGPVQRKIKMAIAETDETAALRTVLDKSDQEVILLVDMDESPRYHIVANEAGYQLLLPDNYDEPVIVTGSGHDEFAAMLFLELLQRVARWVQILETTNPGSTIQSNELKFDLYRTTDPGNFEDDVAKEALDWTASNLFPYLKKDEWEQPGVQLKITNTGNRNLWVGALYMGFDFSITNQLLGKQELKPGEFIWLTDVFDGYPFHTIPLQVEDVFYEAGVVRIKEYIKVLVSTTELDTDSFNQPGLMEETFGDDATRGVGRRSSVRQQDDWISREIELDIYRPEEEEGDGDDTLSWEDEDKTTRRIDSPDTPVAPGPVPSITKKPTLPDAIASQASGQQVDCSVYAPPVAAPGSDILIQVFLHIPEQADAAKGLATEFDEEATRRAFKSLSLPLTKGDELTLILEAKGLELEDNQQSLIWNGPLQLEQFIASIPEDFASKNIIFTLRVFKSELPIGHIKFILKIDASNNTTTAEPVGNDARRYQRAFVSYASKDRDEVLKRVQMLDKVGLRFFQDVLDLEPGQRWEKKLYENIDNCDVFFLFWSSSAKASKWVMKELEYALEKQKGNEAELPHIQPVPIEGPPIVYPPEELGHMHFNDKILYFIGK